MVTMKSAAKRVNKKRVIIKEELCKECGLCILFCPDKALFFHRDFNAKGYHPVKWKGECSFCGRCYIMCPDLAIEVTEDEPR